MPNQCSAITKKGEKCQIRTRFKYCHVHSSNLNTKSIDKSTQASLNLSGTTWETKSIDKSTQLSLNLSETIRETESIDDELFECDFPVTKRSMWKLLPNIFSKRKDESLLSNYV